MKDWKMRICKWRKCCNRTTLDRCRVSLLVKTLRGNSIHLITVAHQLPKPQQNQRTNHSVLTYNRWIVTIVILNKVEYLKIKEIVIIHYCPKKREDQLWIAVSKVRRKIIWTIESTCMRDMSRIIRETFKVVYSVIN